MGSRLERIIRNVLGGEDNALRQQHDAVVHIRGLLALDERVVGEDFNRADARDFHGVANLHFVAGGDIRGQVAAQRALDAAVPQAPTGADAILKVGGHAGGRAEAGDGDILSGQALVLGGAALAGTLLTANINSAKYNLGSGYTLAIITAVVLGGTLNTGGKGSILGTVLASLIICILRYGLPLCFDVSTQNLDLPVGIILVLVVLGREIAGQHMLSHLFKRRR